MEFVTCVRPDGVRFRMRMFGDGPLRFSSRGPVQQTEDGKWQFVSKQADGVVIE